MTNLDSVLKSRHHFADKGPSSQSYGLFNSHESWTIKKTEHRRIDAFELWCWRRLLRVPWTARRSNQSILTEINPEYLLEGLMLKLTLRYLVTWCEEPTHRKRPWSGKDWGQEEKGTTEDEMVGWHQQSNGREFEQTLGDGEGRRSLACYSPWGQKQLDTTKQLNNKWASYRGLRRVWMPDEYHQGSPQCIPTTLREWTLKIWGFYI